MRCGLFAPAAWLGLGIALAGRCLGLELDRPAATAGGGPAAAGPWSLYAVVGQPFADATGSSSGATGSLLQAGSLAQWTSGVRDPGETVDGLSASAGPGCVAAVPDMTVGITSVGGLESWVSLVQEPAAGTLVGLGVTRVTLTATAAGGATATRLRTFAVRDTVAPLFVSVESGGVVSTGPGCLAPVPDLRDGSVLQDVCDPAVTVTQVPAPGTLVGPGPLTVTLRAVDAAGNAATATVSLVVADGAPPVPDVSSRTEYQVAPATFGMTPIAGTRVAQGDEAMSDPVPLGFAFSFYDGTYSEVSIASNGFITFTPGQGSACCTSRRLPSAAAPNHLVALAWDDLNNHVDGISYATVGTAPNRVFIVEYSGVPRFGSLGLPVTGQIKLFEADHSIELHLATRVDDGTPATQGLENADGTAAAWVPGRNGEVWDAANEAWKFTPYLALPPWVAECSLTVDQAPTAIDACAGPVTATGSVGGQPITLPYTRSALGTEYVVWRYVDLAGNVTEQVQALVVEGDTLPPVPEVNRAELGNYSVEPAEFGLTPISGTVAATGDDAVSGPVPIGFGFRFYGDTHSEVYLSANGFLTFSPGQGAGCCEGAALPGVARPNGLIALAWDDLNNRVAGVSYATLGRTPNRVFIVEYRAVPFLGGGGQPLTGQIKLFEADHSIELHVESVAADGSPLTQGLENAAGTLAAHVPGRNAAQWSATRDAWRFSPPSDLPTLFGQCGVTVERAPTALDACAGPVIATGTLGGVPLTLPYRKTSFGRESILWTYRDANGNTSTQSQLLVVGELNRPIARGRDTTLWLDAAGQATVTAAELDNGSSDDCAVASVSLNATVFTGANLGVNPVTFTATDTSGNQSSVPVQVTVLDNLPPTARAQDLVAGLDFLGMAVVEPSQVDAGSSDNTGTVLLSLDRTRFTCADLGPQLVTLSARDFAGNLSEATATVTVVDNLPPFARARSVEVRLDADGLATVSPADVDNGSSDTCGLASLALSRETFTCADLGVNPVILTVIDRGGNAAAATVNVTVYDDLPPVVRPRNIRAVLDPSGVAVITVDQVDDGSSDNCAIATRSLSRTRFTKSDLGPNPVTLTVSDPSGNVASASAMVTVVEDQTPPTVVTRDVTVYLDATGAASVTAAQVDNGSSDAFGIASMTVNPSSFTCANVGANTVTLTVTDTNGNVATGTATVTVVDNIAPTVVTRDVTVFLSGAGTASVTAAQVDDGSSDICGVASISVSPANFTCANVGLNTVTLTVTDVNGNAATGTAVVTVVDNTAPTVVTRNVTVSLSATGTASVTAAQVDNGSSDNCGVASISVSPSSFTCANVGANAVTLTVTDVNGHVATGTATVTVVDNAAPTVVTRNVTVFLSAAGTASVTAAQVDNGSSDNCEVASISVSPSSFTCANVGANPVTLTVTDVNGNVATGTATVTVVDNLPPTVRTRNLTVYLSAAGTASVTAAQVDNGSSDNCGVASTSVNPSSFTCANVGANTVTLTVTDVNGNVGTGTATVTVVDDLPPTIVAPDDITVACSYVVSRSDAVAADNTTCLTVTWTINGVDPGVTTRTLGYGVHTIMWTVVDAGGNRSTDSQVVRVRSNARITYEGDTFVFTAGPTIATASVNLAARFAAPSVSVSLCPVLPDARFRAQFRVVNNGSLVSTLYAPLDSTGLSRVATTLSVASLRPATGRTYDVEVRLFYSENWSAASPVLVDVTDAFGQGQVMVTPGSTNRRMTGGGWVPNSFSRNGRATFGFEAQPAPKSKGTAQGNSTYMLHSVTLPEYPGKSWQLRVKDSSWSASTLGFYAGTPGSSAIDSGRLQCNGVVQLVNSQNSAETISYGNCVIVVDVRDGGFYSPALPDLYSITVFDNKNTILWFSTPAKTALSKGEVRVFSK